MITRTSIGCTFRRLVAGTLVVCLLAAGFPRSGVRTARAQTHTRVYESAAPAPESPGDHFLRDAIPASSYAAEPPDTTDDDFILPEEKSKKQLAKEIAVWVIVAAFVAFFIVKVFIEEDNEPAEEDDNGKQIPGG